VFAHLQCGIDFPTSGRMDCDIIDVNSAPDESAKESSYFHVHGSHLWLSIAWSFPSLCFGRDCYITFLPRSLWIAHSLRLSFQLISRVQPGLMTCVSCLIGLRYVEPLSSVSLHLFSSSCCFFHAMHVIHPSSSRRCPLSGAIEACAVRLYSHTFRVGLILEPREGWIVTS